MTVLSLIAAISTFAAEILSFDASFDMASATSGTLTVSKTVMVNNAAGEEAAAIVLYSDHFCSISSFSGTLTAPTGHQSRIKKSDLVSFAPFDAAGTDTFIHTYIPSSPYPYIVHYEYTLSFNKGFFSFPDFVPVKTKGTALRKAGYTLSVPSGTQIQSFSNIGEPLVSKGKKDVYQWTVGDFAGIDDEIFLPPTEGLLPLVKSAPVEFKYGRFSGEQNSWNELGLAFSELVSLADGLPEEAVKQAAQVTEACNDTISKVKALYAYLRKKTRYVSISFGIGGYKPHDAAMVDRTGFGDCKDLSNYMKNLLKTVGVDSYYCMIDTYGRKLENSTVSATAFNHVVLAVPAGTDTLWLECTNTSFPLGYRHSDVAGHQLLLLDGKNSRLVKAGSYTAAANSSLCEYHVSLEDPQNVQLSCRKVLSGKFIEPYIGFNESEARDKVQLISSRTRLPLDRLAVTSYSDNFNSYPTDAYVPQVRLEYDAGCNSLCRKRSEMLFVSGSLSPDFVFNLPSERHSDICIAENELYREIIHLEGRMPSSMSLPSECSLECPEAAFEQTVKVSDGVVTISRSLSFREGTYPKKDYQQFRTFLESVTKASTTSIVYR